MMYKIAIPTIDRIENYPNAVTGAARLLGLDVLPVFIGKNSSGDDADFVRPEDFRPADYDGLLLPGGDDIDPSFYHEEVNGSEDIDRDLDEFQFAVLDAFVKAGKPVLGICRGHQLVNVYFGGSLIQDIPQRNDHTRVKGVDSVNVIRTEEGSILRQLYGEQFPVNSSHHQAVREPGKGLRITARALDGVAEAMEHESLPIFTTQFHPERMSFARRREDTVDGSAVFVRFLREVAGFD